MTFKFKIELVTVEDCKSFVDTVTASQKNVVLTNGKGYKISAKSFLGALASMEWDNLYAECNEDCYMVVKKWIR